MNTNRLYRLTCGVRHYSWGDRGTPERPPFIAALLGVPADGQPFAELWMGAHPSLPATVADWPGAPRLDALIREQPELLLGHRPAGDGGASLPFLLKVLSCAQPLSIQAHPDRALAACLHARAPQHYPDANHKPEIAVALTPFEALAAFRPQDEVLADVRRLPALARFFAAVPAGPGWLRQAYGRVFTASAAEVAAALHGVAACLREGHGQTPHDRLFSRCVDLFPRDRGALSVYFLNSFCLQPGEAIYLPPNEPHAYMAGTIAECMAASDNVVRAGLTSKHVDVEVLLGMLTYRQGRLPVQRGSETEAGTRRYRVPASEFQVELRDFTAPAVVASGANVSLLLVLEGELRVATSAWESTAARGTVLLWPAAVPTLRVQPQSGSGRWVRAFPGPGTTPGSDPS